MKKRHIPGIEPLEARVTPDVTLGAAACSLALPTEAALANTAILHPPSSLAELPGILGPDVDALSLPALDAFFATSDVEHLLDVSARNSRHTGRSSGLQAWQFLSNYTRKAIRNEELRRGGLADHEDLVHQVFVEWWEQVGPREQAFVDLLNRDSREHFVLRKTVRRVLDHARYERARERRMGEFRDQPAPTKPGEQDWIDLRLDWEGRAGEGSARERQLLELRRQGRTFEEIGAEMGLVKQRVCELYNAALERLQEQYSEAC